jgi:ATP dependent DNA ligase domain
MTGLIAIPGSPSPPPNCAPSHSPWTARQWSPTPTASPCSTRSTRRGRVTDATLQAFDLLELDGEDLRPLPLGQRKPRVARLLTRVQVGIALNEHTDAKGELVFRQACVMGLEGIVSKRLTAPYRSGPSRDKVKNPDSPAMMRARAGRW